MLLDLRLSIIKAYANKQKKQRYMVHLFSEDMSSQSELVLLLIQRKWKIWIGEIQIDNIKCSQWAKIILS